MRRIIKEKDDIKVSIFSGDRLARVFIDSGYRNIAMVIADCGRIANGYGVVYYPVFSCSEDPFHPLGVGMYAGDYYPHRSHMYNFGKRVKDIDSLPKKVIEFIKYITR